MNYALRILLTPSCWLRNFRTGKAITNFIRQRLESGEKPTIEAFGHIGLGGKLFWGHNYPYAYGTEYCGCFNEGPMPSRKVVFMLNDAVEAAKYEVKP